MTFIRVASQGSAISATFSRRIVPCSITLFSTSSIEATEPEQQPVILQSWIPSSLHDSEGKHNEFAIKLLTLNRPKAANSINRAMLSALNEAMDDVLRSLDNDSDDGNPICSAVIVDSSSNKVFCAGADLKERATMAQEEAAEFVTSLRNSFVRLARLPVPVIAAVNGAAFGGGLEMALAADLRVSGKNASFGLTETSLAIIPGAGGTQRLPRLIGVSRAKDMIFRARRITASTAYDYGLIDYLVNDNDSCSKEEAIALARDISKNGPLAIRAAKCAIDEGIDKSMGHFRSERKNDTSVGINAMEIERKWYSSIIPTEDRLEGLAAFREKRNPTYKGR